MNTAKEETEGRRTQWSGSAAAWLGRWMLASTVGGAVILPVVGVMVSWVRQVGDVDPLQLGTYIGFAVLITIAMAMAGAVAGVAQWVVLRKQICRAGWWILASSVGWGVGVVVVVGVSLAVPLTVASIATLIMLLVVIYVVMGAMVGIAQWVVLRKQVRRAGWWILASSVGWGAGFSVGMAVGPALDAVVRWAVIRAVSSATANAVYWAAAAVKWAMVGLVGGAITAFPLRWLLAHPTASGVAGMTERESS